MSTENITGAGATQPEAQAPSNSASNVSVNNVGPNGEAISSAAQASGAGQPAASMPVEQTPVERMASDAYQHTSEAADSLRRGELMQNSEIDPLADGDDRLIALLSYATQILIPVIMPVIVLLSESSKKRPFQRYHAVQSLAFSVLFWGLLVLAGIGTAVIQVVPLIGFLIGLMMACIVPLAWFAQAIMLLYYGFQAYKGRRFAVPGLTSFLRDQNWL
jgi:uncharacterized membrane protein